MITLLDFCEMYPDATCEQYGETLDMMRRAYIRSTIRAATFFSIVDTVEGFRRAIEVWEKFDLNVEADFEVRIIIHHFFGSTAETIIPRLRRYVLTLYRWGEGSR